MRKHVRLGLLISSMIGAYALIFMELMRYEGQSQNVDPITAVYWVVITITTLGYGDVVFHTSIGRLFSIMVSLSGVAFLWAVILPQEVAPKLESLVRTMPTSAPSRISGHIILCGFNPIVETLPERLSTLKIPFLVIERSEQVARRIYRRCPTLWGDPAERQILLRANIHSAKFFIANETEELNAEVILSVREISSIPVIALVNELSRSKFLDYAGASRIISPKTLLGTFIAQITTPPCKGLFPGSLHLFGEQILAEIPIFPWSPLIGKTVRDSAIEETGARIVGIWKRGLFMPEPSSMESIQLRSMVIAVGNVGQLSSLRDLATSSPREGPILVLGYGDVGRRVVRVLMEKGIHPVVVDRKDVGGGNIQHVVGDATCEATLVEAGLKEAVGVLIMLNQDSDVVYSTLITRDLNPEAFIVARANHVQSAEKIYRAGADYVASVPMLASHMLARIVQAEEEVLSTLYEGSELKRLSVQRKSPWVGRTIAEMELARRFGCCVVAVNRSGEVLAGFGLNTVIMPGDVLAIIGSPKGLRDLDRAMFPRTGILGSLLPRES